MKLCPHIFGLFAMAMIFMPLTVQHVAAADSVLSGNKNLSSWVVGLEYVAAPDPFVGDAESASQFFSTIGYIGERFTWLGPYLNYRLLDQDWFTVSAVAELHFAGLDTDTDDPLLAGLDERESAVEIGFDVNIGYLSLYGRHDAFDTHEGGSLDLAVGQRWELTDRSRLEASVYGEWQDENRVQYYYGVTLAEIARNRPAYAPNSSTSYGANAQTRQMERLGESAFTDGFLDAMTTWVEQQTQQGQ